MEVGARHAGTTFTDLLGNGSGTVQISADGWGEFRCPGVGVSVWVRSDRA